MIKLTNGTEEIYIHADQVERIEGVATAAVTYRQGTNSSPEYVVLHVRESPDVEAIDVASEYERANA